MEYNFPYLESIFLHLWPHYCRLLGFSMVIHVQHHFETQEGPSEYDEGPPILSLKSLIYFMMTSSNENIFRVTGHLCGEFTGHLRIPHTKASDSELWCFLWSRINGWVSHREAGDLRRYHAPDVIVMFRVPLMQKFHQFPTTLGVYQTRQVCHHSEPTLDPNSWR